jgi:hypothetical protein
MSGDHDVGRPRAWTRWWAAAAVLTTVSGGTSKPRIHCDGTSVPVRLQMGKHLNEGGAGA